MTPDDATTLDSLARGLLLLEQPRNGYRFGIDAVLLGSSCGGHAPRRILDACCGVAVIGVQVARHHPDADLVGVEIQPALAALAQRNLSRCQLEGRSEVLLGDLRKLDRHPALLGRCDLVLLNPPFFPPKVGAQDTDNQRFAARHEVNGDLEALISACRSAMTPRACLKIIYPAAHLSRLIACVERAGLKAARATTVHSFVDKKASLVLLDALNHGRRELNISPPLIIFEQAGVYSPEVNAMLDGDQLCLWTRDLTPWPGSRNSDDQGSTT